MNTDFSPDLVHFRSDPTLWALSQTLGVLGSPKEARIALLQTCHKSVTDTHTFGTRLICVC